MADLHARCFSTPRPWSAPEFAAIILDPLCFVVVEPHGFLIGRTVAGEAEVLTLAVDPGTRRQGTGAQLVDGFLAQARARGATSAFLEVSALNHPAICLYLRAGFSKAGRRKGYYVQPDAAAQDALVLARAL